MALPSLEEFRSVLPEKDDGWCELFRKYIKLSVLIYFWHKYRRDTSGHISDDFAQEICRARSECVTTN